MVGVMEPKVVLPAALTLLTVALVAFWSGSTQAGMAAQGAAAGGLIAGYHVPGHDAVLSAGAAIAAYHNRTAALEQSLSMCRAVAPSVCPPAPLLPSSSAAQSPPPSASVAMSACPTLPSVEPCPKLLPPPSPSAAASACPELKPAPPSTTPLGSRSSSGGGSEGGAAYLDTIAALYTPAGMSFFAADRLPEDGLAPLTRWAQHFLHDHQHRKAGGQGGCGAARYMVSDIFSGLGSMLHVATYHFGGCAGG